MEDPARIYMLCGHNILIIHVNLDISIVTNAVLPMCVFIFFADFFYFCAFQELFRFFDAEFSKICGTLSDDLLITTPVSNQSHQSVLLIQFGEVSIAALKLESFSRS